MSSHLKSILVTGAGSGIGRETALFLASRNFHVFAGVRNPADLSAWSDHPNITPVKLDVTCDDDVDDMRRMLERQGTGLFGLVNNAGTVKAGPLMDVSTEDMREQFEVNLLGVHQITRAVFPFLHQEKGRIVMMSSDSGFFATPFAGPYCASKFALEGYSDSLRREVIPHGVKVILIEPGHIKTPIWDKGEVLFNSKKDGISLFADEARAMGRYMIRKGKTGGLHPVEVAKVVYQALTVAHPKLRYIVAENKFEYQMMKILPAWCVDKLVVSKVKKITKQEKL